MESSAPSPDPRRAVGLVLLGTVSAPKRTALGRLLARLGECGLVDPPLIRVSASHAAGEVGAGASDDELELGASGDPGEDVVAAARALGSRFGCELLIVVDGDSDAGGEESLELLDRYALRAPLELDAIVGTIVRRSETEAELGRGPFLVPTGLVERLTRPPEGAIEGPQRSPPFDLRREGPHEVRTPFGGRTRGVGVAVIDLRVVRALRDARVGLASIGEQERQALLGLPGLDAQLPQRPRFDFWLDEVEIPEEIAHGEIAEMRLRGWVVGAPMPDDVELFVDYRVVARGSVRVPRPDVLISRPELSVETCGFELSAPLGPFAPGAVRVRWSVVGGGAGGELGTVRVARTHRIGINRVLVPARGSAQAVQWIRIDGSVSASAEVTEIEVVFGGHRVPVVRSEPATPSDYALPSSCRFVAATQISDLGEADSASLLVRSRDAAGGTDYCVRRVALVRDPDAVVPAVLERREIGCRDPVTGRTRVCISGVAFGLGAADRVVLRSHGRDLAEARTAPLDPSEAGSVSFEIDAETEKLPVGEHRFELVGIRRRGSEQLVAAWNGVVVLGSARVAEVTVTTKSGKSLDELHRLVVEGRIEDSDRVESLALAIDGRVGTRLGAEWLRRDEPGASSGAVLRRRFRFDTRLALSVGHHELEIRARRGAAEVSIWRSRMEVAPPPRGGVGIACEELDRLMREDPAPVWSRLILDGRLVGAPPGTAVRLWLADREAARSGVGDDGGFRLEADPGTVEILEGRLEAVAGAELLLASPTFRIAPRRIRVPQRAIEQCQELVDRCLAGDPRASELDAPAALERLLETDPGDSGRVLAALRAASLRAAEARAQPASIVEDPGPGPGRPLSVLFAAWEVPSAGHGGGVLMVNLLRELGARHEITLLHAQAPGEEGVVESVRPLVREIVSARREWGAPAPDSAFGVPAELARSFSPELRRAIEAEAATGRFDLVDYEYTEMALHSASWGPPSVGALYESQFFAEVTRLPERLDDVDEASAWLGRSLRALHFETALVPERFGSLLLLTREEAERLAPWLPGRRIFVQPIPIDLERFARVPRSSAPEPPTFVFVGSHIHPPNREAAAWLATHLIPALRARLPAARWVLGGASPPAAVGELAASPGVEVPGFVEDLEGLLGGATAFVAPLFSGGGMRVKLLEAMAAGCPVITTRRGLNGIRAEPGREALVAETVDEFVAAAERLAADPAAASAMGEAGRNAVAREHSLSAQGERRERIWQAVISGRHGRL